LNNILAWGDLTSFSLGWDSLVFCNGKPGLDLELGPHGQGVDYTGRVEQILLETWHQVAYGLDVAVSCDVAAEEAVELKKKEAAAVGYSHYWLVTVPR